jgi:orotate phosphoribosyltransferase-like protein
MPKHTPVWKIQKAVALRKAGWSYKAIAVEINVPQSTVRSWWAHRSETRQKRVKHDGSGTS